MKRLLNPKFLIAVCFFCLGFLTNHLLVKFSPPKNLARHEERIPIDPNDFDQKSMLDTIARMQQGMQNDMQEDMMDMSGGIGVDQREDDKFVYYDIPLKGSDGNNHKLNVEIKDGMVRIKEDTDSQQSGHVQMSSERMFSIDPNLDSNRAEVINNPDKITIKIPKK